jgi:hypothetical protein
VRSSINRSGDSIRDAESFLEIYDANKLTWSQVCLNTAVWTKTMEDYFCLAPP